MSDIFERLRAPFPPDRISWRVGSTTADKKRGMALAYIDARDVMERLDEVCGAAGWQNDYPHANGKTVCRIGIKVGDEWVWKADGAGDTDVEAEKGALSDAFKRSAVRWGIGRYLYDLPSPWVELDQAGRSYKIKESEMARLAKLIGGKAPPRDDEKVTSGPQASTSPEAKDIMSKIDLCANEQSLMAYGEMTKTDVEKLNDRDHELVRLRFKARLTALRGGKAA